MESRESNAPEKLLDATAVAELLGLHVQTVYEKARTGELPGVRIGRLWRFRPSDVSAYQEDGLTIPTEGAA